MSRVSLGMIAGAAGGIAAGLVFAAAHAVLIVPIWNRMAFGLTSAAVAGLVAGWAFVELGFAAAASQRPTRRSYAVAGLRFGALLWLAVVPVTMADTVLRLAGIAPRLELLAVAVAIILAVSGGLVLGSRLVGTRRAMVAGATATLFLTVAMAGPVPLPNGRRAISIFLAVFPACLSAGLVLGLAFRAFGEQVYRSAFADADPVPPPPASGAG